jgi:hypothetical protein
MRLPSAGAVSVANITEGNSTVEAYTYSTTLPGTTTTFNQTFAFHVTAAQGQFASVGFVIGASTLKWSIVLAGSSGGEDTTVRYRLSSLTSSAEGTTPDPDGGITRQASTPHAGMTTYQFSLLATSATDSSQARRLAAQLVVFDAALIDGALEPVPLVGHSVALAGTSGGLPEYVLSLTFPPYTTSLEYDPAINLNEVRPDRPQQAASSGDSEFPIVAAVVPPAALVGLGLVVAVVLVVWKVRRSNASKQRRPSLTDQFGAQHQRPLSAEAKHAAYALNRENWVTA